MSKDVKAEYVVDAAGGMEALTAKGRAKRITIRQKSENNPAVAFRYSPTDGGDKYAYYPGEPMIFEAMGAAVFEATDPLGFAEMVSGSETFQQIEEL